jgi:hypothetical protein
MKNQGLNHIPSVRGYVTNLSINLILIGIFYVFLGGTVSYALSKLFPEYDETWKSQPLLYKVADVSIEVSAIVLVAFWLTYFVNSQIPVFRVSSALEHYLESFGGQMIFIYAVFIFMETLDDKLIVVFREIFGR